MAKSRNRSIAFTGPWLGMELREGAQTEKHCELAINVDFSRSYIEARKGFEVVRAGVPFRARVHLTDSLSGKRYLLIVGVDSEPVHRLMFCAIDLADHSIVGGALQDLTTDLGERFDQNFQVGFLNTLLPGQTDPHFVTLITTQYGAYVYDPEEDASSVRVVNTDKSEDGVGDSLRSNEINFSYWVSKPLGSITCEHQGRTYYAGFRPGVQITLSGPLEEDQNAIPETYVADAGRTRIGLGPHAVAYSDEFDPVGIQAHHFFGVEEREAVTGLASFQENLVVFTERSIYVMTGGTDATFALHKAVSGVGCIAQDSIIEVHGALYFMAHDGIYAFGGLAAPTAIKISKPIDALWTGQHERSRHPDELTTTLYTRLKWPWSVALGDARDSQVLHYRERNQIWWSLPIASRAHRSHSVTAVWDYGHQAWSLYTTREFSRANGTLASPMFAGVSLVDGPGRTREREQIYTVNGLGELQRYGHYRDGTASGGGDWRGIPMVWLSGRIAKENFGDIRAHTVRFRLLSTGKTPATNPPRYVLEGEKAHVDYGDTPRSEQAGDLTLHLDTSKDLFWESGDARWGGVTWAARDWFGSKTSGSVRSPTFRVGLLDDADTQDRPTLVVVQGFSVEVGGGSMK